MGRVRATAQGGVRTAPHCTLLDLTEKCFWRLRFPSLPCAGNSSRLGDARARCGSKALRYRPQPPTCPQPSPPRLPLPFQPQHYTAGGGHRPTTTITTAAAAAVTHAADGCARCATLTNPGMITARTGSHRPWGHSEMRNSTCSSSLTCS